MYALGNYHALVVAMRLGIAEMGGLVSWNLHDLRVPGSTSTDFPVDDSVLMLVRDIIEAVDQRINRAPS